MSFTRVSFYVVLLKLLHLVGAVVDRDIAMDLIK
jgi:hypothetical protein